MKTTSRRRMFLLAALALLLAAGPAAAQRVQPSAFAAASAPPHARGVLRAPPSDTADVPASTIAFASLGGALVGGLFGAGMVAVVVTPCSGAWCGFPEIRTGAFIGQSVGAALGAHLANRKRGDLGAVLLVAGVTTALGWTLAGPLAEAGGFGEAPAVPIAIALIGQAAAVAAVERHTTGN